jgi:hypothetical protein
MIVWLYDCMIVLLYACNPYLPIPTPTHLYPYLPIPIPTLAETIRAEKAPLRLRRQLTSPGQPLVVGSR